METENRQSQLSERARQNLQRNTELRNKETRFFNPQPGDKAAFLFNAEKVEPVEIEFDGKKVQRFQYTVKDPNMGRGILDC
jgi:hypothetical protein